MTTCPYLTHLCDGVVKDSTCIICSLSHQFDLPGPWGQSKVWGVQLYNLTSNLHKDWFTLPPPRDYREIEKEEKCIAFIQTKATCDNVLKSQLFERTSLGVHWQIHIKSYAVIFILPFSWHWVVTERSLCIRFCLCIVLRVFVSELLLTFNVIFTLKQDTAFVYVVTCDCCPLS